MTVVTKGEGSAIGRLDACAIEAHSNVGRLGRERTARETRYLTYQCQIQLVSQGFEFRKF